jgi:hypothetical protein
MLADARPLDWERPTGQTVSRVLEGLTLGQTYKSSDLYERYRKMAEAEGAVPAHQVAWGRALRNWGALPRKVWDRKKGHPVAGWTL